MVGGGYSPSTAILNTSTYLATITVYKVGGSKLKIGSVYCTAGVNSGSRLYESIVIEPETHY